MHSAFQYNQYVLKRQVLALTGKLRLYSPSGQMILFCQQKMFKLKEDIRVYADESQQQELLYIQARQIMDFSAAYDVIDRPSQTRVGTLRRKGFRSMLRDEWEVLDANERPIAVLIEDNVTMAVLRRFVFGSWIPQNYDVLAGDTRLADIKQKFNPFRYELDLDFSLDTVHRLDHRLGIAAGILLAIIEGRQN